MSPLTAVPAGVTAHVHDDGEAVLCCVCELTDAAEHAHVARRDERGMTMFSVHTTQACLRGGGRFIEFLLAHGFSWVRVTAVDGECDHPEHAAGEAP